eukprot:RCo035678
MPGDERVDPASAIPPGDPGRGEFLWKGRAAQCHSLKKDDNRMGPTLYGIFGKQAGTQPGFYYSQANAEAGFYWDDLTMFYFLENPKKFLPGCKMAFAGLKKPQDRADIIAYMRRNGGEG